MSKVGVNIKDWPFEKGEKVKLTWIGEPFKENNKWMVNTYFKGSKATRKIIMDWANIHFLSIDKYYTDGNLNNGGALENKELIDINLTGARVEYIERPWEIWGTGFKEKTKSKTFNFYQNGLLYTIPIIEVIRAVLASDKFLLNRILEMDTLENYFTYDVQEKRLGIHFTSDYDKNLLKNEKINHLAWLITNPKMLRMFNAIGQNLWQLGELKFDFLFDRFNISARVEKKEKYIRVLEIVSLKKKRINAEDVNIYHPCLEETEATTDIKKRKFISKKGSEDRELDSNADGSTKAAEEISTFLITHEYEKLPKINKVKGGRKIRRSREDENTQKYISEDDKLRTTADAGGEHLVRGLEFRNLSELKVKGELQEFIEMLKLLEKRQAVKSVDIIVDYLPEGKKFSKLNDRVTCRRYAIGKITMIDGRENCLIEVEREDKALSMLLLKANKLMNWKRICSILIMGLINESGKWSSYFIEKIYRQGVETIRKKHSNKRIQEREKQIYNNLVQL